MNIGIFVYNQAEVLDFSGPFEVFSTASRLCTGSRPFEVFLIGETGGAITARGGYSLNPHYSIQHHPEINVLIIAGGVHTEELKKTSVIKWIAQHASHVSITASVCTGAFLLAQATVLDGHKATTHWEDIADLRRSFPQIEVMENVRWVDEDSIITSAGISAGIDMSLHLVSRLHSNALALRTAKQMDFTWTKNT